MSEQYLRKAGTAVQSIVNCIVLSATFATLAAIHHDNTQGAANETQAAIAIASNNFRDSREARAGSASPANDDGHSRSIFQYQGRADGVFYWAGLQRGMTYWHEKTNTRYSIPCDRHIAEISALFVAATTSPTVSEVDLLTKIANQHAEVLKGYEAQCRPSRGLGSSPEDIMNLLSPRPPTPAAA